MNIVYDESAFFKMSDNNYSRRAQIPISSARFHYLTKEYSPENNNQWILFHHPGHFIIYNKNSRFCRFDASYIVLRKNEDASSVQDNVFAVIPEMIINNDSTQFPEQEEDGDISLLSDLLERDL